MIRPARRRAARNLSWLLAGLILTGCRTEEPPSFEDTVRELIEQQRWQAAEAAVDLMIVERRNAEESAPTALTNALVLRAELCLDSPDRAAVECEVLIRGLSERLSRFDPDPGTRVGLRAHLAVSRGWDRIDQSNLAEQALEAYRQECLRSPDSRTRVLCLSAPAAAHWSAERLRDKAREMLEEQLMLARGLGDPNLLVDVLAAQSQLLRSRYPQPSIDRQQEAIQLLEQQALTATPRYANMVRDRGTLKARLGDYSGAHQDLSLAARGMEALGATNDRRYTLLRAELGHLLLELGDLEASRESLTEGLDLALETLGPKHPATGEVAGFLAEVLVRLDELEAAERTLAVAEVAAAARPDPRHWRTGRMQFRRADVEWRLGRFGEAERHIESALSTLAATQAAGHQLADALGIQGRIFLEQGRWDEADRSLTRSLELNRTALGPEHARVGLSLALLAELRLRQGRLEPAIEAAIEAETRWRAVLRMAIASFSERQVLLLSTHHQSGRDLAIAVALASGKKEHRRLAWDLVIRSRLLSLEHLTSRARERLIAKDPAGRERLDELRAIRSRLASAALRTLRDNSGDSPARAEFRRLAERKDELERSMLRLIPELDRTSRRLEAGQRQVAASLAPDTVLVAFVRASFPGAGDRYAAFVLSRRRAGTELDLIDLGSAAEIDHLVEDWTRLTRRASSGLRSSRWLESAQRRAGEQLRERIWDPVAHRVDRRDRILIVAAGELHRIVWGALPIESDGYLLEHQRSFHILSAERDLVAGRESGMSSERQLGSLVALGAPDFGLVSSPPWLPGVQSVSACTWPPAAGFEPLPGAQQEVTAVAALWRQHGGTAHSFTGGAANIDNLIAFAPRADVLHLATHAYFIPPVCRSSLLGIESPLHLSGLVLSGPESTAAQSSGLAKMISSDQLALLDLQAQWVVLSGCETGVGDVAGREGVLGLRTALQRAGAKAIVTSLWPVPDHAAARWLSDFYRYWLGGSALDVSARAASLAALQRLRADGRSALPALWTPFVTVGTWR